MSVAKKSLERFLGSLEYDLVQLQNKLLRLLRWWKTKLYYWFSNSLLLIIVSACLGAIVGLLIYWLVRSAIARDQASLIASLFGSAITGVLSQSYLRKRMLRKLYQSTYSSYEYVKNALEIVKGLKENIVRSSQRRATILGNLILNSQELKDVRKLIAYLDETLTDLLAQRVYLEERSKDIMYKLQNLENLSRKIFKCLNRVNNLLKSI